MPFGGHKASSTRDYAKEQAVPHLAEFYTPEKTVYSTLPSDQERNGIWRESPGPAGARGHGAAILSPAITSSRWLA